MTGRYRWTGTNSYRDHRANVVIEPGEVIPEESAERIASAHPGDVEEVEVMASDRRMGSANDDVSEDGVTISFDQESLNVPDLEDRIVGIDDLELLKKMKEREEENEDRKTVLNAITARIEEL